MGPIGKPILTGSAFVWLMLSPFCLLPAAYCFAQSGPAPASARTLTVVTEPATIIWLDEIRRGTTDEGGKLVLSKVAAGAHTLRARANGFKEITMPVNAAARGEIPVRLTRSTDKAELIFQRAETARETARNEEQRERASELYRQALQIRAEFPAAHVGLARVLLDLNSTDDALKAIDNARRYRESYPEASAVEGRVYRELGQTDEAIGSFNRALRETHGFQPEAHVGVLQHRTCRLHSYGRCGADRRRIEIDSDLSVRLPVHESRSLPGSHNHLRQ